MRKVYYIILHTYIYVYIPKYVLISLYDVTCIYIFRTNYLILDSQLVRSSLVKSIFPTFILYPPVYFLVHLLEFSPLFFLLYSYPTIHPCIRAPIYQFIHPHTLTHPLHP